MKKRVDEEETKKSGKNKKNKSIIPLIVLIILIISALVLLYLVYANIFRYTKCDSWDCFNSRLEKCYKTDFIGGNKMIFEYRIIGRDSDKCIVDIKLLQGELNNQESIKMEKTSMKCDLPFSVIMIPESNLNYCSGKLKEGLQDLIINRLYSYIIENIGKIGLESVDIAR